MDRVPQRIEEKLPAGDPLMLPTANRECIKKRLDLFRYADLAQAGRLREERRQMVRAWAYPFGHRHGEAALLGERIGGRQRLFEPPAQQIFALSSSDLEPIGKLERNIRDDGIEQRRAAFEPMRHQAAVKFP